MKFIFTRPGRARQGEAWQGEAWRGRARLGGARQGSLLLIFKQHKNKNEKQIYTDERR